MGVTLKCPACGWQKASTQPLGTENLKELKCPRCGEALKKS